MRLQPVSDYIEPGLLEPHAHSCFKDHPIECVFFGPSCFSS